MPVSTLQQYTSSDVGGPGLVSGTAGSLIAILKACLVDGYGALPAAGWTQPVATAGNIGSFKQGAGAGLAFVLNDNGPNGTATFKEAWITGWETVLGVGAPVGTGTGQFPTPAQLNTTGHGVVRKSVTADGTGRAWRIYADASTMYLFISTGDTAGTYNGCMFGDVFSLAGAGDLYRCALLCQATENSTTTAAFDQGLATATTSGHFMARTYGGGGASITGSCHGDMAKSSAAGFAGIVQAPNGPDNAYYLSPIWLCETTGAIVRGRLRGLFQFCHAAATVADGQTFSGGGDFAGKSFQVVRLVNANSSPALIIETSATVETN